MDNLFKSRDEAVSAALEFARTQPDRRPEPCADPIHAMWGVEVVGPKDEVPLAHAGCYGRKGPRFLYPRFKHPLDAVIKVVPPAVLIEAMRTAKEGLFASVNDPYSSYPGALQACRYDLERGMSFVSKTWVTQIYEMDLPERVFFANNGWKTQAGRFRLGGYGAAREAEYTQLREVLNPPV